MLSSRGSLLVVTLSTLAVGALAVGVFVAHKHPGDMRSAALLGQKLYHPPAVAGIPASTDWGYDGQFYLILATDPLVLRPETAEGLDNPPYRAGRMLVPLSAWLLALGHAGAATYLYLFVCWIGGWLSVPVAARYLQVQGHSPWWAWLLLPSVGLMASTLRCLPDGMGLLLFLVALYCFQRHRYAATTGWATLATLARETSWLANLGLAYEQIKSRRFDAAASHLFVPLIALLLWRILQQQRLPAWGAAPWQTTWAYLSPGFCGNWANSSQSGPAFLRRIFGPWPGSCFAWRWLFQWRYVFASMGCTR